MPNLKTDRTAGMARGSATLNVRRLMYQSLIWPVRLGNHARRLGPALDAQQMERAADALIDGVRGNLELDRDFLGRQMLVNEKQAIQLAFAQPGNALPNFRIQAAGGRNVHPPIFVIACVITLHQHEWPFTANGGIKQKGRQVAAINMLWFVPIRDEGSSDASEARLVIAGGRKMVERAGFEPA